MIIWTSSFFGDVNVTGDCINFDSQNFDFIYVGF